MHFLCTGKWIHVEPVVFEVKGLDNTDSRLSEETYEILYDLLQNQPNMTNAAIAREAGCGETTVCRHRKRLAG
jgi:predicted transcriptional regulator